MDGVPGYMSVSRAARELGVTADRVRELIAAGQLGALKPSRELLVDSESVRRRVEVVRPASGRPLSPPMAWALLWYVSGLRPEWVGSTELSRIRRYIGARHPRDWPRLLRLRAAVHPVRMLVRDVERLRADSGVAAGGVSAVRHYGLDLVPAVDEAELYVDRVLFERLSAQGRIGSNSPRPNVLLRVPALDRPELLADPVVPRAVVAADLLDQGGERETTAAFRLLDGLGIRV